MKTLLRLIYFVRPFWPLVGAGVAAMALITLLGLVPPLLMRTLVDEVVGGPRRAGLLGPILVGLVALYAANAALVSFQLYIMHRVAYGFARQVRCELYDHLQGLSLNYYESRQTGEIMSRVTSDVEVVQLFVEHGFEPLFSDLLKLIGIAGVLFWMNATLATVALLPVPIIAAAMALFAIRVRPIHRQVRAALAGVSARLQDNLAGIRVIKAFSQEDAEGARYGQWVDAHHQAQLRALRCWSRFNPGIAFVNSLGSVAVLGVGAVQIVRGELTLGGLFAFTAYVAMFYQPVRNLSQVNDTVQQALSAADRLFEIFDVPPDVQDAPAARPLPPLRGHVRFDRVSFRYDTGEAVLRDVELEAFPGETIALVGRSGAGKTTIINLLARFYDPTEGRVRVDGYDLREVQQGSLRSQMAMVLQDTFLFNGTVRENIGYGRAEATDAEIEEAARAAHAHEFILELPSGYETPIGERGVKLSGGQKQRLAIARALLADPKILILDEATSSVDSESECLIQEALEAVMRDRTTFVIAHRLSTVKNADRIVTLENGRVHEVGDHHTLIRHNGIYSQLYELQFALQADDR